MTAPPHQSLAPTNGLWSSKSQSKTNTKIQTKTLIHNEKEGWSTLHWKLMSVSVTRPDHKREFQSYGLSGKMCV